MSTLSTTIAETKYKMPIFVHLLQPEQLVLCQPGFFIIAGSPINYYQSCKYDMN